MESFGSEGGGSGGSSGSSGGGGPHACWRTLFADDEGAPTRTSREQAEVEGAVCPLLAAHAPPAPLPPLQCAAHLAYLHQGLRAAMGADYTGYDASRVWLVYWCLQALDLLGAAHGEGMAPVLERCCDFLSACQHPQGGFGGGPQQEAHAASTYAAAMACLIIGTPRARALPDRAALGAFFTRLKGAGAGGGTGAFAVTADGESDTRGTYTVLAAASALGVLTPALRAGCAAFLAACQGAEGGFGGEPGNEAHGGYTYCALAALAILGGGSSGGGGSAQLQAQGVDVGALQRWLARRQMASEGGFSGRCNKLVDACYSFWVGASCALAGAGGSSSSSSGAARPPAPGPSALASQLYVLAAAQGSSGCRDKPGKSPDFYHTCYALAGLSVAVWGGRGGGEGGGEGGGAQGEAAAALQGLLFPTDCVYNVRPERLSNARAVLGV